jgi:hypothetical protein
METARVPRKGDRIGREGTGSCSTRSMETAEGDSIEATCTTRPV